MLRVSGGRGRRVAPDRADGQGQPAAAACSLLVAVSDRGQEVAPGSQPDGTSVVIDAPAGLIVVDTGRHAELIALARAMLEYYVDTALRGNVGKRAELCGRALDPRRERRDD